METQMKPTIWFLTLVALFSAPHLTSAYYDPGVQRWINRDPIEESGGVNLYEFAANGPTEEWDAFGLLVPLPRPLPPIDIPIPIPRPIPRPPVPIPTIPRPPSAPHGPDDRERWYCDAKCNVQQIDPNAKCPSNVEGHGEGSSEDEACRNAKRDATQKTPCGCYPRHCRCPRCYKGRPA